MGASPSNLRTDISVFERTFATADHLDKVEHEVRAEIGTAVTALHAVLDTRISAMDKAATVLSDHVNRVPTLLDREVSRIREVFEEKFRSIASEFDDRSKLFNEQFGSIVVRILALEAPIREKFNGIETQFRERDVRTDQDKLAATTAVNAALQAQKEAATAQNIANAAAINKSEAGFTKEIDGLKLLINATKDALTAQFTDLTGRINRGEAALAGSKETREESRLTAGSVMGIVGGVVGVLALIATIIFGVVTAIGNNGRGVTTLNLRDSAGRPDWAVPSGPAHEIPSR